MRRATAFLLPVVLLLPGRAYGATKAELRDAASRAAERLSGLRTPGLTWEDAPYLVGLLLVAREFERNAPGSGQPWTERVASVVGDGASPIASGDYAGYAQAAMDLYRVASPTDPSRRASLLSATSGPFDFAFRALRVTPSSGPPASPWWLEGGYGTRFWVDDLFTLPPWLAMRGSSLDGLPADPLARDLAYEWIESYLYDHRPPATTGPVSVAVPSQRRRAGALLWDPAVSLFRHDPGPGFASYWGRGNGWAAWGLARSARYLDAPYQGGRFEEVVDRTGIREVLSRLARSLAARRSDDGGWPTDLVAPGACPASETSATGLITYMLAKGVHEGWLDRATFTPVVLKSLSLLLGRIDEKGDLAGIQPPGTGPDCGTTVSNDPAVDVSYGVGAFLLAVAEALDLPDDDLAAMEVTASHPVDRTPVGPTFLVALPGTCARPEVVLTNAGAAPVNARLEGALAAGSASTLVPPGGTAVIPVADEGTEAPVVLTLRTDGDLGVRTRAICDPRGRPDEANGRLFRFRPQRAGTAAPLWTALAAGEETTFTEERGSPLVLGGQNVSPVPASLRVVITPPGAPSAAPLVLELPPDGTAFETRFVPEGSRVTLSNVSGGAVVPLVFVGPAP